MINYKIILLKIVLYLYILFTLKSLIKIDKNNDKIIKIIDISFLFFYMVYAIL